MKYKVTDGEYQMGQDIVRQHIDEKKQSENLTKRKRCFSLLVILAVLAVLTVAGWFYFSSPVSQIRSIKIIGNDLLSDDYIMQATGLNYSSKYALVFSSWRSYKAQQDPLIAKVEISTAPHNGVVIEVTENTIIGYQYETDIMELILADGSTVECADNVIKDLDTLPMYIGFSDEKIKKWAPALGKVDLQVRLRMSEVQAYSLSWDDDMIKCVMDDGYQMFLSYDAVDLMDQYLNIITSSTSPYACIFLDKTENVAIMRDCQDFVSSQSAADAAGNE